MRGIVHSGSIGPRSGVEHEVGLGDADTGEAGAILGRIVGRVEVFNLAGLDRHETGTATAGAAAGVDAGTFSRPNSKRFCAASDHFTVTLERAKVTVGSPFSKSFRVSRIVSFCRKTVSAFFFTVAGPKASK